MLLLGGALFKPLFSWENIVWEICFPTTGLLQSVDKRERILELTSSHNSQQAKLLCQGHRSQELEKKWERKVSCISSRGFQRGDWILTLRSKMASTWRNSPWQLIRETCKKSAFWEGNLGTSRRSPPTYFVFKPWQPQKPLV